LFARERLYTETAARVATEAFANVQFTCEFFALLCGEHKVVANESTIQLARMNQFHFMSKNIKKRKLVGQNSEESSSLDALDCFVACAPGNDEKEADAPL
jgi:hypothetical protein